MPSISVIVGTYNHLMYLKLSLYSLERQTFKDFEVIIADDGSGPDVGEWIKTYHPFYPLKHLWQEDKGFRKCRILNRAVREAKADYLVFMDADCVLAKDFLLAHWEKRGDGIFLGGRRVMLAKKAALLVTKEMIAKGYFDGVSLWGMFQTLLGKTSYYEETFRPLYSLRKESPFSLLGCNFSIHKHDLLFINGFDEEYESRGGGEDTDVALRLKAAGRRMASVRYLAIQTHLGHEIPEDKSRSAKLFAKKEKKVKTVEDAKRIKSSLSDKR
ncbi:MAG: glycosyltransferase [Deltaproteobacteria bacterium]|nr:glycosyltransferase [Deltaproteobacteria bacterium]